ncbi:FecR domain-containing protein [Pseudanabaena sp. FACHB-1998]|uniref:FecR domain-containing protein n=1 Tax=Pseudanabaena sp. FACHB-1998 TaxID=2692858 RepID=UPI001681127A|nr:FecR domain-containing protein [Pseudanabaena sp. FACHB-1998]MBD2175403.1 FecR domain-containing protein [Pseudanabaena sp. FACHB-1998]
MRLPHQQKRLAFFFTGLCIFALAAPQIAPVSAQASQATVQEILDGNQVFIQNRRASVSDVARQSQQVRTGNSRTALLFNTGAVARLSANSVLKIGQCANLRRGTILINGAVNACSSGITTGVRGTTYLLEVDESGNQQVKVLEGEVVVKRNATPLVDSDDESEKPTQTKPTAKPTPPSTNSPTKPSTSITSPKTKQFTTIPSNNNTQINLPQDNPQKARPLEPLNASPTSDKPILKVEDSSKPTQPDEVVLKAGEKVEVDPRGALGIIQQLTQNEFITLLQGDLFQGFTNQIPGLDKVRSVFEGLFPGVNFPISIPGIPTPNIPIPSLPRFPF